MKLHDIVEAYVDYKHSLGMRFRSQAAVLRAFDRAMGTSPSGRSSLNPSLPLSLELARSPLAGSKTTECLEASTVMLSAADLRRYLRSPRTLQGPPTQLTPYIYTVDELKRLLAATEILQTPLYLSERCQLPFLVGQASAFLATRTGIRLDYKRVSKLFCRIRQSAEIRREATAQYQPRIHDIRRSAAVHRVIAWYRAGADVQKLLPQLATYLGHVDVASTQRYLTMTAELLNEASFRFERYAEPEVRHA